MKWVRFICHCRIQIHCVVVAIHHYDCATASIWVQCSHWPLDNSWWKDFGIQIELQVKGGAGRQALWLHINIPFSMQNHNWDIYVSMQHLSWTLMISIHSRLSWQPGRLRDNRGKQLQNWRQSNELRCVAHLCEGPHGHFCVKVGGIEMKSARYIVYLYMCICIPTEHCLNKHNKMFRVKRLKSK